MLFHVQKLFNWFYKYAWYFVAHIFVNSCFHSWNVKNLRNITMNRYQFVSNNVSRKNTNVKSEINKLSTNKGCHFLEIIVPINETAEHLHSSSVGHTWYTSVTAENWPRDATNTQTLDSLVHNCYTWKVTAGRNQHSDSRQPSTQLLYQKSDRGSQLVLWPYTARYATDTLPLSEKWPRDATSTPRDRHPCPMQDSNPQPEQSSGHWGRL
jgi:hypothetical protein